MKTAMWRAVQKANPDLSEQEVTDLLHRVRKQEYDLVFRKGLNLDQARELTREELFPPPTKTPD